MPPRNSPKTPPAGEAGKRYPLNLRTTEEVRLAVEAAANRSGRSLAQEVEHRLEQSFRDEIALGGPEQAEILRIIQAVMDHVSRQIGRSWLEDATAANIVSTELSRLFKMIAAFGDDGDVSPDLILSDESVNAALRAYEEELREWEAIGLADLDYKMRANQSDLSEDDKAKARDARAAKAARGPRPKPDLPSDILPIWEAQERSQRAKAFAEQIVNALLRSRGIDVPTQGND